MAAKKRGLGRGLDALLPKEESPGQSGLKDVPVERINPGRYQPRTSFTEASIAELAASIQARGVVQPIILRPLDDDRYEIIAGERRWRAARQAGLDKVPAVIRIVADEAALAMSLIENIQRENLNPMEEARALKRLIDDFEFTHEAVAKTVGRSRSAVTNTLRLLGLPELVAQQLVEGKLETGHARALLALDRPAQVAVARLVVSKGLNVRQTEALVRNRGRSRGGGEQGREKDADTRRLEQNLGRQLGQPVRIQHTRKGRGKLIVSYNSLDELDGLLAQMGYREQ